MPGDGDGWPLAVVRRPAQAGALPNLIVEASRDSERLSATCWTSSIQSHSVVWDLRLTLRLSRPSLAPAALAIGLSLSDAGSDPRAHGRHPKGANKPFGLNFLTFDTREDSFSESVDLRPAVMQFAWARPDQDLKSYFNRAHDAGCKVTYMAGTVPEAIRATQAGADVIIAQGTEGGGHVGWMASMPLIPMVVDDVAPLPVLAAGGFADGRGLVAAFALGAQGILLGTRFLATVEFPLHPNFKQAIVDSDGHDTQLSEIPDIASGLVWPGAMTRSRRNRFIERWAGREWLLRQNRAEALSRLQTARESGDVDEGPLSMGQDAGLVRDIPIAAEVVARIAHEADDILKCRDCRA